MKRFVPFIQTIIFLFTLQVFATQLVANDCEIGIPQVTVLDCDSSGYFSVQLNFEYANIGDQGFQVQGNGNDYGNFEYTDLPVLIGPLYGDGETEYEFVVTDIQYGECSNWTSIDPVDCVGNNDECYLSELSITYLPCVDSLFSVNIDFDYENVSAEGFSLYINDSLYDEYSYEDLPVTVGSLAGDGQSIFHFLVEDYSGLCASDANIGPVDCDECGIWDVVADVMPCNDTGYFEVEINFSFQNVSDSGFSIVGNGNDYGDFNYEDLPVTVGPLYGDGETEYEFVVMDNSQDSCSSWTAIDPVDCGGGGDDCELSELTLVMDPCQDSLYNLTLDFDYENVSEDGFMLYINDSLVDMYGYDDLPLTLTGFAGDGMSIYHFLVEDFSGNCASDADFGPIDCDECGIWDVEAEVLPCNDSGYFDVKINFSYQNVSDSGFSIVGNGNDYGDFNYEDLPVTVGPLEGDGETEYEFIVMDNVNDSCGSWTSIEEVECNEDDDCYISELTIDDNPCENGEYTVYFDFDYENVSDSGFVLQIDNAYYGTYSYDSLPLQLGPFAGDGETVYHFAVFDLDVDGCASDADFGPISCDSTSDCDIWDVEAIPLPCNDSGYFTVKLNFNYENVGEEGFSVTGSGYEYGSFAYDSLPVFLGPLYGDGETEYEFVVTDNQFEGCSGWTSIEEVDCNEGEECEIDSLVVEVYPCENGYFDVDIDFEYENVSEDGFKLFVNWDLYESYSYDDLPVTAGPFEGDGETSYHFMVKDASNEGCAEDTQIDPVECDTPVCNIWDMEAVALPCNDQGEFDVLISFEYENTGSEGFDINGNGTNYGTFAYSDLPVTLGPFVADGITEYEFAASDNEFSECNDDTSLEPFECDTAVQFTNVNMEIQGCQNDTYYLLIDFDVIAEGVESFTIFGNGTEQQTFLYSELPVQIGPLTNDEVTSYYFIITNDGSGNFGNYQQFFPFTCESLGINPPKTASELVIVYPNPSDGKVNFRNLQSGNLRIDIYDLTGNRLNDFTLEDHSDMKMFFGEPGLYFYRITDGKHTVSGKFTIR